jgi:hypothetical protein
MTQPLGNGTAPVTAEEWAEYIASLVSSTPALPPSAAQVQAALEAIEALAPVLAPAADKASQPLASSALQPDTDYPPDIELDLPSGVAPPPVPTGAQGIVIDPLVPLAETPSGGVVAYGDTFKLQSLPNALYTVYLDFDGHTTTGTSWNSYWSTPSFYSPAYSLDTSEAFNANELLRIQQIWQRVAEYFSPFNINVTTKDPGVEALRYAGTGDTAFGVRVVVTDEGGKNFGGIAYVGSFDWNSDTPAFVYANRLGDQAKQIADAAAHEAGHSLGLKHDGQTVGASTSEYYYGHGSGVTDWAPVMGVGYNANIVQWSKGAYYGATNLQDDLTIITTQNSGVNFKADDWGNDFATAGALGGTVAGGVATVATYGIITGSAARNDIDMFWLEVGANGSIDLTVATATRAHVAGSDAPIDTTSPFTMLDVGLTLYNGAFQAVATYTSTTTLDGRITATGLAAGRYYLAVDGVGWGTPGAATPTGYNDYGSLGQYMVKGTYTADVAPPPPPPPPPSLAVLELDRAALITGEGGTETVVLRAIGATGEVVVGISGLNAAEGLLSASSITLNAANNWTADLAVTGVDDDDADGDATYTLTFAATGYESIALGVTNMDDDRTATNGGKAFGTYTTAVGVNNATVTAQSSDGGSWTGIREGVTAAGATVEFRWQFANLAQGDKVVQLDASSTTEAIRFQYSADGIAWQDFVGAPGAALVWSGEFLATGVGATMWVRMTDTVVAGDATRDLFVVDLLTVSDALEVSSSILG